MGFLDSIFALFTGGNDPDASKKKRLRQIVKDLTQNKYSKFYRTKTGELDGPFAKFFYDVYKIISPAQIFLQNAAKSDQLKQITVEAFLDKEARALKERLSAESIEERGKTTPVKDMAESVKRDLSAFAAGFDNVQISRIDTCYNSIISLVRFVSFDFFFIIKKFDSNLSERNFTYQPKFKTVKALDLSEEIKDFMEYSAAVEAEQDWKAPLAVLKLYKDGMDVVNHEHWGRLIRLLRDVSRSRILELIVQHNAKDPLWQSVPKASDERVADSYLDAKKAEIEKILTKIQNDKRSAQIEQLARTIFGSAEVERLLNYTAKANELFQKKNFDGFTKVAGLNYLKAFLLDYFKKEIKELCDLFLIRGQWTSNVLAQSMSDAFHGIMGLIDKISALDDALGEKGEHGSRLKQALIKVDRDKGQGRYIRLILKTVNNSAQEMINAAASGLITIGKNFKVLLEDMPKKPAELIMNWKELEGASEQPLGRRMADDYKRMYYFVQLLQFFAGPVEEET
ncbi:MAG: DUF5312 domain-containing protein [Treponema sp.]|jgi:hypothetical protein|nr:DUF5312 domain-containing protein [Treponema sp.]